MSTTRLIFRLIGGEAGVDTVGGAGTDTMLEVVSGLHIMVASSSENLLLLIKWGGLREGETAATISFPTRPKRWGVVLSN